MPDRRPKPNRPTPRKEKLCKACRRPIPFIPQKARDWDILKYCSEACSGYTPGEKDAALDAAILELLAERGPNETIDPTEAAKYVGGQETRRAWESLLEPARSAARRLATQGKIQLIQQGKSVALATATGPFQLRLPSAQNHP